MTASHAHINPDVAMHEAYASTIPAGQSVQVDNIEKSFRISGRTVPILKDISLDIRPGEFISIVGKSGCGKSTLLRILAGLEKDFSGRVSIGNRPIRGPSLDCGLVFQDHRLFPWLTVQQNIGMALRSRTDLSASQREGLVRSHIELVRLDGFENAYPHQLSGGMAQRAAIARALVNDPSVLLLDEPLGAVDALTRLHLQRELQRIWITRGTTMIMVTHDIEEALLLGDRVIILQQPRPGSVQAILDVTIGHPRSGEEASLRVLRKKIFATLHIGSEDDVSA